MEVEPQTRKAKAMGGQEGPEHMEVHRWLPIQSWGLSGEVIFPYLSWWQNGNAKCQSQEQAQTEADELAKVSKYPTQG